MKDFFHYLETAMEIVQQSEWEHLSPEEKKKQLFLKQKKLLDMFLEKGTITQAQHDKSLGDLIEKMGVE